MGDAAAHIENLTGQIQAVAQDAAALREHLHWRDMLLEARAEAIRAKDARIAWLDDIAAGRAAALEARDALIRIRDASTARMQAELRELRREFGERMAQAEADSAAAVVERDVARREFLAGLDEIARIQHETQALRHSVTQAFTESTSWRVTAPLRAAIRLLRREARPPMLEPLPPPPAPLAPPPIIAAVAEPESGGDVMDATPAKDALRGLLLARLQTFLASPRTLRLPRAERPEVSIVLVLYNQAELTFACLGSIAETLGADAPGIEVVIVDNQSNDLTAALLDRVEGATVLRNRSNLHFLKAVNQAAAAAAGRTILLLNNDAQLLPGAVASALRTLDFGADIGAVGGRIILPDGTLQEAGSIIWRDGACTGYGRGEDPNVPDFMFQRDVDYCSGAFLLTPTAMFRELGGFDERFAPAYYEETDYCVRLWESGRRVVFDPDAAIIHYEFASSQAGGDALALQAAHHAIFVEQHRDWLAGQYAASPGNVLAARAAHAAKRVLVLEDRIPKIELGSGYPRANRIVHELLEAGAQVTFFPMYRHRESWLSVRQALDKRVEVLISAEGSELRAYLEARRGHFDAVLVCRPHNMRMLEEAIEADPGLVAGMTILYDAEAVFATRQLQRLAAAGTPAAADERHRIVADEITLTRMADAVISVASAEQAMMQDYGATTVRLLGHALDDAPIATGFDERDQIAFLGAIHDDHTPNADSLRWFAEDILPILRQSLGEAFRLTVVGMNDAPSIAAMDGDTLDLLGAVDDLAEGLSRARVLVVPTRFAAGIPHKVHQAAMLGIPMVVTGLVAEQLGWNHEIELLVADTPEAFAAACARAYQDRALWESLRERALARARQECAPERFSAKLRAILADVKLTHRMPEQARTGRHAPPPPPPEPPAAPVVSRPARTDYSAAVPFGYPPPAQSRPPRIAVICHLFHAEVAREVLYYLQHLPVPADLLLSTDSAEKCASLQATFGGWDKGRMDLRVMQNRGRDIAPKLVGFADAYDRYDLVLHLHSKVSNHAGFLAPWRGFLLENLLGSEAVVSSILEAFARLPDLGMVAPQHYEGIRRWLGWQGNFEQAKSLAARMGITLSPTRALDFPSGSMFWARPAALRPLLDLRLSFDDFPAEDAQVDETPAHAIERLYFHVCERSGHSWIKVAQPALYVDTSTIVEISSPVALSQFVAEHGVLLGGPAAIACAAEPAAMATRVPPGLASRLAARTL